MIKTLMVCTGSLALSLPLLWAQTSLAVLVDGGGAVNVINTVIRM